jgi:hypothetical protein
MPAMPVRTGFTSSCSRTPGAFVLLAVAGIWLGGVPPAPAGASACANDQFRSGPSGRLPDCRAYELVSPPYKAGADAVTIQPVFPAQAAACPSGESCALVYMNAATAFDGAQGNEVPNAYRATRGAGGWQTTELTPPTLQAPASGRARVTYDFSDDLAEAVLRVPFQTLAPGAPAGVYNLFSRQVDGRYALVTASPPSAPPQPGCGSCFEQQDVPAFAGASADFSHVIFEANDSLLKDAPQGGVENLYETVAEQVRLVGILPDGAVAPQGATPGAGISSITQRAGQLQHAISQSGSNVLFEAAADGGAPDPQQAGITELYDRIDGSSTVEVSAPAAGAEPSKCETKAGVCAAEPARFWAASADGSVVYFTSSAALTRESYTGTETRSPEQEQEEEETGERIENPGTDLYRYDVGSGALSDLTVDGENPEDPNGASVLGVVGASTDGSYVYFVADGDLAAGATSGQPNLYVSHQPAQGAATVSFIATLQAPEEEELENIEASRAGPAFQYHSDVADWTAHPTESQAYVTPDGRHLAFMSVMALTGYDNHDQTSGEADHEVFEYSAETGQLACASCDASGAPPLGSAFLGAKLDERASTPFHQPRSLSDDGSRLFFSSPDPLVPGLSGATAAVFEYEDGAAQLISGTEGGSDDMFLDASASGDDVFLATRQRLAASDADELVDVYDARVDGGLPAVPAPPPPCQGSACQEPFSSPAAFAAPVSALFTGPGNLAPRPAAKPTREQLLSRALARCRKLRDHHKRAVCVAAAKRRYAPKARVVPRHAPPKRRPRA